MPPELPRRFNWGRLAFAVVVVVGVYSYVAFGPGEDSILRDQVALKAFVADHFLASLLGFLAVCVVAVGASLPVGAGLSILAGFFFDVWWGMAVVNVGFGAGAVLAFLSSRYLFREAVYRAATTRPRLRRWIDAINLGLEREGGFYLLTVRLMAVVPYFVLNFLCGLTTVRLRSFWWATQLGMIPATFIYVYAGAAAREITSFRDLVSFKVIAAAMLLVLVPIALRWAARRRG